MEERSRENVLCPHALPSHRQETHRVTGCSPAGQQVVEHLRHEPDFGQLVQGHFDAEEPVADREGVAHARVGQRGEEKRYRNQLPVRRDHDLANLLPVQGDDCQAQQRENENYANQQALRF